MSETSGGCLHHGGLLYTIIRSGIERKVEVTHLGQQSLNVGMDDDDISVMTDNDEDDCVVKVNGLVYFEMFHVPRETTKKSCDESWMFYCLQPWSERYKAIDVGTSDM